MNMNIQQFWSDVLAQRADGAVYAVFTYNRN